MSAMLTQNQLKNILLDFRHTLGHFDYSSIKNLTFLNAEAFYAYVTTVKGNPFEKQYEELQQKLDKLQPYLPFVSSDRAKAFLKALDSAYTDEDIAEVKRHFTNLLRDDFVNFSRTVTTDAEWERVIDTCEEIRLRKEEMLLAHS